MLAAVATGPDVVLVARSRFIGPKTHFAAQRSSGAVKAGDVVVWQSRPAEPALTRLIG